MILNVDNFKSTLKGISIIEVSGESCANCYSLMPLLAAYVKKRDDCMLHHLEVSEETMPLVEELHVVSVPTIIICHDDEIMASCRGFQPEEILTIWLDSKIAEIKQQYHI